MVKNFVTRRGTDRAKNGNLLFAYNSGDNYLKGVIALTLDLDTLWNFNQPKESEKRFLQAQKTVTLDEALILETQIARTYGLRGEFEQARKILRRMEENPPPWNIEVRARHALEWGRTLFSVKHPPEEKTPENVKRVRMLFQCAHDLAQEGQLDALSIDALHMLAMLETEPTAQLARNREALHIAQHSSQAKAQAWQASLHHNIGCTLHEMGDYPAALQEFTQALVLRESQGKPEETRVARWMIAWTLRSLGRTQEALDRQLGLEKDYEVAGQTDPYVYEELAILYHSLGNETKAEEYRLKGQLG